MKSILICLAVIITVNCSGQMLKKKPDITVTNGTGSVSSPLKLYTDTINPVIIAQYAIHTFTDSARKEWIKKMSVPKGTQLFEVYLPNQGIGVLGDTVFVKPNAFASGPYYKMPDGKFYVLSESDEWNESLHQTYKHYYIMPVIFGTPLKTNDKRYERNTPKRTNKH